MDKDLVIMSFSLICMVLCVSLAVCACKYAGMSAVLGELAEKYEVMYKTVAEHDRVMVTYKFFNEKWENGAYCCSGKDRTESN